METRSKLNRPGWLPPLPTMLIATFFMLLPLFGGQLAMDTVSLKPDDVWFLNLFGVTATPTLAQFIPLLALIAAAVYLLLHRVVSLPRIACLIPLGILTLCLFISVVTSDFKSITIPEAAKWIWYLAAFLIVLAATGRKGVKTALVGLVIGLSIVALVGIKEYAAVRASEPTYRIFAGFNNPNAAGAAFLFGIPLAVTLFAHFERLPKLLFMLSALIQSFALVLTQSKGALLFVGVSVVITIGLAIIWKSRLSLQLAIGFVVCAVLTGGLAFGLEKANAALIAPTPVQTGNSAQATGGTGPLNRFSNLNEATTQSAGFRKLLWQGTAAIIKQRPMGIGMGAYRFWSARPGLTTQTQLAHNSYLQLACEASPIALLAMCGLVLVVFATALKGITKHTEEAKLFGAGIVGALVTVLGHNLVDSDIYTFGLGAIFFGLLGLLIAQGADARSPELVSKGLRAACGIAVASLTFVTLLAGIAERQRAEARGFLEVGKSADAKTTVESLLGYLPSDGQAQAIRTSVATSLDDALEWAQRAAATHPTPKNYRLVANLFLKAGQPVRATEAIRSALIWDPNNLPALLLGIDASSKRDDIAGATDFAKRLIAVESTSYYTVRSQPELVPTETFEGRIWLASRINESPARIELLEGAVRGFAKYRDTTIPLILRMTAGGAPEFGGEDTAKMTRKLTLARSAISTLKGIYRKGVPAWIPEEDARFASALAKLAK